MIYLGVDGGGTKTAFALIDATGNVLAEHEETTCYYIEVGIDAAKETLRKGTETTLSKAGKTKKELGYAFFGLPAYGEDSALQNTLDELPSSFIPQGKYQCDNDMVNGWAAAFDCADGINIVSGTGSIAYGVRQNKAARGGGWGEIFSDEGSAYWVGREGLNAFSKMSDDRIAKGPLYKIFKTALSIEQDLDISALVHTTWKGERSKIAEVSTLVSQAALAGDQAAISIFERAGQELALIVEGTKRGLDFPEDEFINVSYSGGIFSTEQLIMAPFDKALRGYSTQYRLHKPSYSPVIGAARYARELSKLAKT